MTDNEIIKFIEHTINSAKSEDGFKEIYWEKLEYILDLINRQKAENERLQKNIDGLNIFTKNHTKVIRLQAINEFAEELEFFVLNEDIEVVEPKCKDYESYINGANQFRHQIKNGINNLVKEMTEVNENDRA